MYLPNIKMVEKFFCQFSVMFSILMGRAVTENHRRHPNIIFIVADDLGWNDVGFHGSNQIPTPNIDALAYRGVILNNYYTQSLCTPSRCALMTGKYPIHTGMQHYVILNEETRGLPLSERLLPEYLKDLGYSTHAIGKWHLGFYKKEYTPEYRGFDSHIGHWTGVLDYYNHFGAGQGPWGLDLHRGLKPAWDVHGRYLTNFYTEEAVNIIKSHRKKLEKSDEEDHMDDKVKKPLFLYLSHIAVHSGNPYNPLPAPEEVVENFSYINGYKRRRYAAILHLLDQSVGTVVEALAESGILNDSIIIFTTDNGGPPAGFRGNAASNWPLRGTKNSLWEGGVRGAAVIWSPLLSKSGYVSNQLMHITDWLPTLLSAINGSTEGLGNIDGFDSWTALSENRETERSEILLNIDSISKEAALRVGDWKVIIGTALNGSWNGWYGPSGLNYNDSLGLILDSKVSNSMDSLGYFLSEEQILFLRNISKVTCEAYSESVEKSEQSANHIFGPQLECNPVLRPCLFNIKTDPCEKRNLADVYPEKLEELMTILGRYNSTAIPPSNTNLDFRANPAFWGYTWTNYGDKKIFE